MKPLSTSEAASRLVEKRRINSTSPLKAILAERLSEGLPPARRLSKEEMEKVQRVRAANARLRAQGEPLAGKRGSPDYLPTQQRMAKGDLVEAIDPSYGRRYQPKKNVVDQYQGKWGDEVEYAFMRLVDDSRAADIKGVTINYMASGSRSASSKLGGLGAAKLEEILAYQRYNFILDHLPRRCRKVVDWLLIPREAGDRQMTLEDVGRMLFPHFKDARSLQMLGLGYFSACGDKIVALYSHLDMESRVAELRVKEMRTIGGAI